MESSRSAGSSRNEVFPPVGSRAFLPESKQGLGAVTQSSQMDEDRKKEREEGGSRWAQLEPLQGRGKKESDLVAKEVALSPPKSPKGLFRVRGSKRMQYSKDFVTVLKDKGVSKAELTSFMNHKDQLSQLREDLKTKEKEKKTAQEALGAEVKRLASEQESADKVTIERLTLATGDGDQAKALLVEQLAEVKRLALEKATFAKASSESKQAVLQLKIAQLSSKAAAFDESQKDLAEAKAKIVELEKKMAKQGKQTEAAQKRDQDELKAIKEQLAKKEERAKRAFQADNRFAGVVNQVRPVASGSYSGNYSNGSRGGSTFSDRAGSRVNASTSTTYSPLNQEQAQGKAQESVSVDVPLVKKGAPLPINKIAQQRISTGKKEFKAAKDAGKSDGSAPYYGASAGLAGGSTLFAVGAFAVASPIEAVAMAVFLGVGSIASLAMGVKKNNDGNREFAENKMADSAMQTVQHPARDVSENHWKDRANTSTAQPETRSRH